MRVAKYLSRLVVGLFFISPAVFGHHSVAEFDTTSVHVIEGEVTKLTWRNPHIIFDMRTTNDAGQEELWRVESASIGHLDRQGVSRDSLGIGTRILVAGHKSSRRDYVLNGTNVLLPSGAEILLLIGTEPRFSETYIGGRDWIPDAPEGPITDDRGIFRVWSWDRTQAYMPGYDGVDGLPLTDSAAAATASWDILEDPAIAQCTPAGMASVMSNPYPIEFVDMGERIELQMEIFDLVRVIHMVDGATAEGESASPLGYSVGRWDGPTLGVTTTLVNFPYFNRFTGVPQSNSVEIRERFTIRRELNRLDYELVVTDPTTFTEPFHWEGRWLWRPTVEVQRYDCTIED